MPEEMNQSFNEGQVSAPEQDEKKFRVRSKSRFVAGTILICLGIWSFLFQKGLVWGPIDVIDYLADHIDVVLPLVVIFAGIWLLYQSFTKKENKKQQSHPGLEKEYRRLYRSSADKKILGVAGGIAEYFDWDPTLVRMSFIVMIFATSGFFIVAYLFAAIATPYDYEVHRVFEKQSELKVKREG
ncbi:MAG: PspC domain-containing protein [Chloroherpetonaceae bacterium]|nr:PspC domain-containing protein [Chloroherpetonaceae bacterium]